ncbi:hypothetical protein SEA_ZOOMAN_335 [Microbacterium phage Zooman]|nr:hypothetical protein SEA_ZOOMAN_22 [Microbacterium phage Zooman]UDL16576.1 hypothetical protein SEA_ZOOMAN_335 [Microbacterium phage Zooman]
MLIKPQDISPKPYYSYAFVQGSEADTIVVKGHLSMQAAKRTANANMRKVRAEAEASPERSGAVLMGWAYGKVEDSDRMLGIIV